MWDGTLEDIFSWRKKTSFHQERKRHLFMKKERERDRECFDYTIVQTCNVGLHSRKHLLEYICERLASCISECSNESQIYTYVYIYVYVRMYIYVYIKHTYIYMYMHMCTYAYV